MQLASTLQRMEFESRVEQEPHAVAPLSWKQVASFRIVLRAAIALTKLNRNRTPEDSMFRLLLPSSFGGGAPVSTSTSTTTTTTTTLSSSTSDDQMETTPAVSLLESDLFSVLVQAWCHWQAAALPTSAEVSTEPSSSSAEPALNTLATLAWHAVVLQVLLRFGLGDTDAELCDGFDDGSEGEAVEAAVTRLWPLVLPYVRQLDPSSAAARFEDDGRVPPQAVQAVRARSYSFFKWLYQLRTVLLVAVVPEQWRLSDSGSTTGEMLVDAAIEPPRDFASLMALALGTRPLTATDGSQDAEVLSSATTLLDRIGGPSCLSEFATRWLENLFVSLDPSSTADHTREQYRARIDAPPLALPFRLVELPTSFDKLLLGAARTQTCPHCHEVPSIQALCLICNAIVCYGSPCCAEAGIGECTLVRWARWLAWLAGWLTHAREPDCSIHAPARTATAPFCC